MTRWQCVLVEEVGMLLSLSQMTTATTATTTMTTTKMTKTKTKTKSGRTERARKSLK